MSQPATPEWLQEHLSTLLASPYIHFNQPKLPGGLHLRMGPGPIDLFSTRFANMFTKEATGVVAGVQVDKEGLKQSLLALQKQWSADTARFVATEPQSAEFQAATKFTWTPKQAEADTSVTVIASAAVNEEGGLQRISSLVLDGEAALFQPAQTSTTAS